ncbi:hypothetical protein KLP28_09490 [Nocardioidaceae bacterium]|nr:hypothetical protein KLP28_09490 [Nocardioidaceae bacterium]
MRAVLTRGFRVLVVVVSSLPGFALAPALLLVDRPSVSDQFFLLLSAAQLGAAITAHPYEGLTLANLSFHIGRFGDFSSDFYKRSLRISLVLGSVVALPTAAIAAVVHLSLYDATFTASLAFGSTLLLTVPVVACVASSYGAVLIASEAYNVVLFSNFFRGVFSVAVALLVPSYVALCGAYLAGEVVRLFFLLGASRRLHVGKSLDAVPMFIELHSLPSQVASGLIGQSPFTLIRSLLALGPPGLVSIGEFALRIFIAVNQVVSAAVTMPSVGRFPKMVAQTFGGSISSLFREERRKLFWESAAWTCLAMTALWVTLLFSPDGLPDNLRRGSVLGLFALLAVPVNSLVFWQSRITLFAGWTRGLIVVPSVFLIGTAAAGFFLLAYNDAAVVLSFVFGQILAVVASSVAVSRFALLQIRVKHPELLP